MFRYGIRCDVESGGGMGQPGMPASAGARPARIAAAARRYSEAAPVAELGVVADISGGAKESGIPRRESPPTASRRCRSGERNISAVTTGAVIPTGHEKAPPGELAHQVLGQRGVALKVGMLGIVKELAVNDTVPAPRLEHVRPVDQHHGGCLAATLR